MERGYGWDEHCEDGLAELRRLRDSGILASRSGQRKILDRFIEAYSQGTEDHITGTTFYPVYKSCPDKVHKKTSKIMTALKQSIDEYYQTDAGQSSGLRIEFAGDERTYRLRIQPVQPALSSAPPAAPIVPQRSRITYTEIPKATFSFAPITWAILCLIFGALAVILGIDFFAKSAMARTHWTSLIAAVLLAAATVLFLMVMRTCYLVFKNHFGYFIGEYFIRRDGRRNTVAVYTAACSMCPGRGQVRLTYHRRRGGYRAECGRNPDQHRFSFDHVSLTGEPLPV